MRGAHDEKLLFHNTALSLVKRPLWPSLWLPITFRLLSPSSCPIGHWAQATWPPYWSLKVTGSLLTQEFASVLFSPWNVLPWSRPPSPQPGSVPFLPSHLHSQVFLGCPIETPPHHPLGHKHTHTLDIPLHFCFYSSPYLPKILYLIDFSYYYLSLDSKFHEDRYVACFILIDCY